MSGCFAHGCITQLFQLFSHSHVRLFSPCCRKLCASSPAVHLDHLCHKPGPTGLVTGTQTSAIISVEVFIEQDIVLPVRILLKFLRPAVDRTPALASRKNMLVNRSAISLLTSNRFIILPDPVGHSILKLSP